MATTLAAAMNSAAVYALPSVTNAFVTGAQEWSDDSAEILVKGAGNVAPTIEVGDSLVGLLGITSFPTSRVPANTVNELTSLFAIKVKSILPLPGAVCGDNAITSCASFEFEPTGDFNGLMAAANAITGSTIPNFTLPNGDPLDPDTISLFIEDATPDFNRDGGTQADAFDTASDGVVRLAIELAAGNSWFGTGPTDLSEFALVPSGQGIGSFSINATIYDQNFPGYKFAPLITATGNIKPTDLSDFNITDDATFQVTIERVPEPATLGLFGIGIIAAGLAGRRRKTA